MGRGGNGSTLQGRAVVLGENGSPSCLLDQLLADEGFYVTYLHPEDLEDRGKFCNCDLVLLDVERFDERWQDACLWLRTQDASVPIVVFSEHSSVSERVKGLDCGADEFLGKPCADDEVTARLRALMRRASITKPQRVLRYADLAVDLATRTVHRDEVAIEFSRREFSLLTFFMQNAEKVLSRKLIFNRVWGERDPRSSNVVDVYVNYLRTKLERQRSPRLIQTVRRRGYILVVPSCD